MIMPRQFVLCNLTIVTRWAFLFFKLRLDNYDEIIALLNVLSSFWRELRSDVTIFEEEKLENSYNLSEVNVGDFSWNFLAPRRSAIFLTGTRRPSFSQALGLFTARHRVPFHNVATIKGREIIRHKSLKDISIFYLRRLHIHSKMRRM
jgi:hypothetical protein